MQRVTNEDRRTQWMASRVLLKRLIGTTDFVDIYVDQFGRPQLQNFEYRMSISHGRTYTAVILSERYNVGIDIESVRPDLARIKTKFMRPDELESLSEEEYLEQVLLYWSAKEVMYKIYAKRKLDFRAHMGLLPFKLQGDSGFMEGWVKKGEYDRKFDLEYRRHEDHMLVWSRDIASYVE